MSTTRRFRTMRPSNRLQCCVVARVTEAERVPDLVDVGLEAVGVQPGPVIVHPRCRNVDVGRADDAVRPVGVGSRDRSFRICAIVEVYLGTRRHLLEGDADDVGPLLQRGAGKILLGSVQRADVDGDRAALRDIEMMRVAAPVAGRQVGGDRVEIGERLQCARLDRNLIASRVSIVEAANIDVISAGRRGSEAKLRIAVDAILDVVVTGNDLPRRIVDVQQRVGEHRTS